MKKICIITTISETMGWFLTDTAKYLSEHGFDVTLVCNMPSEFQAKHSAYAHCINIPMARGLKLSDAPHSFFTLYRLFRKEKFDIIQYTSPNASLYSSIAGKLAGIKVRLYCQWGLRYVSARGLSRRILKALEKITCNYSTWIEPDSFGNLKLAREEGLYSEKKSSVVWNGSASGVDLHRFDATKREERSRNVRSRLGIPDDAYVFGFVGRVDVDKGFNEMIAAFQRVSAEHEDARFLFVGLEDKIDLVDQQLYKWSKESDRVVYTGVVPDSEVYESAMDCLLLPSYREGFGSVVIEAGALGIPVIATDIIGPQESIINGETGFLVEVKSSEALYEKMELLYNDRALGQRLGLAAMQHVKGRYDHDELMKHILEDRLRLINEQS